MKSSDIWHRALHSRNPSDDPGRPMFSTKANIGLFPIILLESCLL